MRCFVGLKLPEEVLLRIEQIQNSLPVFWGKKTPLENIHLTLKFLGEIDEEKLRKIQERLYKIRLKKLKLKVGEVGVFSFRDPRIIWVRVFGSGELQAKIDEAISDFFEKERRFMAHITIARVKKVEDRDKFLEELSKIKISPIDFEVNEFYLFESQLTFRGPKYRVIQKYILN